MSSDFKNSEWHILVVDDDPAMRDMVADYLMAQNIWASTAADSQQMMHVLAAGGIDLAVLDLKLGHESGFDVVRALRTGSDLPIIMLRGQYRDEVDRIVGSSWAPTTTSRRRSVRVSSWRAFALCFGANSILGGGRIGLMAARAHERRCAFRAVCAP